MFPLAGFWSKDEILNHAGSYEWPILVILAIAAFCTAFYMGRQLLMVFFNEPRSEAAAHAEESPWLMTFPLIVLAGLAAVAGFLNLPFFTERLADINGRHPEDFWLVLEAWLEHAIPAFEYYEQGLIDFPKTPIVISLEVAGISMVLALLGLFFAWLIYRDRPKTVEEPDALQRTPIWWFAVLPLNTFYMKGVVPAFNRTADWLAIDVDWVFWHDFVHNRLIRDTFVAFANFSANVLDAQGVDGLVNGTAAATRRLAGAIRTTQTGYARTYALFVFLGAVALLVFFLLAAG